MTALYPTCKAMEDITDKLENAKILINQMIGSHQGTPEAATQYAIYQLGLPQDVASSLIQYANQLNK